MTGKKVIIPAGQGCRGVAWKGLDRKGGIVATRIGATGSEFCQGKSLTHWLSLKSRMSFCANSRRMCEKIKAGAETRRTKSRRLLFITGKPTETKMNIDDLTYGELKTIAAAFGGNHQKQGPHPFVGRFAIVRCYAAGVHAGEVVAVDGETVLLRNSRRLWNWKAVDGIALSGVAQNGIKPGCKLDSVNPEHYATGVCEIIPCSPKSKGSFDAYS